MSGEVVNLPAIAREKVLELLRYRVQDPFEDVKIEINDFMNSEYYKGGEADEKRVEAKKKGRDNDPISLYTDNARYYFELASVHLKMAHILARTQIVGGMILRGRVKRYADWGAGAGRDCIVASRLGVETHHIDIGGEGEKFAEWRYKVRGLDVKIWDITREKPEVEFDLISNFDCLEHVKNPMMTLADIIEHLRVGGILLIAVDFYNFDIEPKEKKTGEILDSDYHLPENFVYGGITQVVLDKLGMRKVYGMGNPFLETATASLMIYIKEKKIPNVKDAIREETLRLLRKFRGFYDSEIKLLESSPKD